jgi:nitrogenase molybdenum-iron protein alpha/beta subunit
MDVHRVALEAQVDLLIGDNHFLSRSLVPAYRHVELGFPSVRSHALHESPTLGFSGWTWLVNRLVAALAAVPA